MNDLTNGLENILLEYLGLNKDNEWENDFFTIKYIDKLDFAFYYKKPEAYSSKLIGNEFLRLNCSFYRNEFWYQIKINELTISTGNSWSKADAYSYKILKLIGYIAKSQKEKGKFYFALGESIERKMREIVENFCHSFPKRVSNTISNRREIEVEKLFAKPIFYVERNTSNNDTHHQRVGKDNKVLTETKTYYKLITDDNDFRKSDSYKRILEYLSSLKELKKSSTSYYSPLGEDSYVETSYIDAPLTLAIKKVKTDSFHKVEITQPNLSIDKIKILIYLLMGDFNQIVRFIGKYPLYTQFLIVSYLKKLFGTLSYSIYDSNNEIPYEFRTDLIKFVDIELKNDFDMQQLTEYINYFIINITRQTNDFIHNAIYTFFGNKIKAHNNS